MTDIVESTEEFWKRRAMKLQSQLKEVSNLLAVSLTLAEQGIIINTDAQHYEMCKEALKKIEELEKGEA